MFNTNKLFLYLFSFAILGLISCNQDPEAPASDSWKLQEPNFYQLETGRKAPLYAHFESSSDPISIYDEIQFSAQDIKKSQSAPIRVQVESTCVFRQEKISHSSSHILEPKMRLAWFLPDQLTLRPNASDITGTTCSFEFKAKNGVGSIHVFRIPTTQIEEGSPESPIALKRDGIILDAESLVHQSTLASTVIDLDEVPSDQLQLRCEHFSLEAKHSTEIHHTNLQVFDYEKAQSEQMIDPLREVYSQLCRVFLFRDGYLRSASTAFELQFDWPQMQVSSDLSPGPAKSLYLKGWSHFNPQVVLENPSSTPLYALVEKDSSSTEVYQYSFDSKRRLKTTLKKKISLKTQPLLVDDGAIVRDKGAHLAITLPPKSSVVFSLSYDLREFVPLHNYGFAIKRLLLVQQTGRAFLKSNNASIYLAETPGVVPFDRTPQPPKPKAKPKPQPVPQTPKTDLQRQIGF